MSKQDITIKVKILLIVRAIINGGWKATKEYDGVVYTSTKYTIEKEIIFWFDVDTTLSPCKLYSFADLMSDREATKAAYGDKTAWVETSDEYGDGTCYDTHIPACEYHPLEAFKLLLQGKSDEAVNYLFNNLPKGQG